MKNQKENLFIYYSNSVTGDIGDGRAITFESLVRLVKSREFFKSIGMYRNVYFYCPSFTGFARPFFTAVICRMLGTGAIRWIDKEGDRLDIGAFQLFRQFGIFVREQLTYRRFLRSVEEELEELSGEQRTKPSMPEEGVPCYLRCDMSYGYIAGGSIGHIAGVVNNLKSCTGREPLFITSDTIPTVDETIRQHIIKGEIPYGNIKDISSIAFSRVCYRAAKALTGKEPIRFIYQRSALNSYAGIQLALKKQIPFILEYNGSEFWISKKWGGRSLKACNISEKIERLTFEKADLITCVSSALMDQLVQCGVNRDKIIVTPNGVNPALYRPDIPGDDIRNKLDLERDKIVVGFIGTYGAWHGAEILAEAFALAVNRDINNSNLRMLWIGDGLRMPAVKAIVKAHGIQAHCRFAGVVPQREGPEYLAACDILVSPQIKNPDGTPFFGSPTKLFEYMAMGKAIIASDLDQLAEVCEDGKTALLCKPGVPGEFTEAIVKLAADEGMRGELGKKARETVCEKYTWEIHTRKIVEALKERWESPYA